jgi:hypothetical protein
MEQINFNNTYFTTKNMIPSNGESISLLWARKLVNNMANTYGIIGTCLFNEMGGYRSLNLQLTQKYSFPPSVYLYYKVYNDDNLHMPKEVHPTFGEYQINPFGIFSSEMIHTEKVYGLIQNDNLIILCPKLFLFQITHVYYRIVGV